MDPWISRQVNELERDLPNIREEMSAMREQEGSLECWYGVWLRKTFLTTRVFFPYHARTMRGVFSYHVRNHLTVHVFFLTMYLFWSVLCAFFLQFLLFSMTNSPDLNEKQPNSAQCGCFVDYLLCRSRLASLPRQTRAILLLHLRHLYKHSLLPTHPKGNRNCFCPWPFCEAIHGRSR